MTRRRARLYGLVTTYYVLVAGWVVAGLALEARWIIRFLAPHEGYFDGYVAVPWLSLGWALYGLWVVFLVIAGRAKVTRRNFPAALVGLIVNIVLLVVLVPGSGSQAPASRSAAHISAMLTVMHLLVRSAFAVDFEWRRLVQIVLLVGAVTVAGDLLLPTSGAVGLLSRAAVFALIPLGVAPHRLCASPGAGPGAGAAGPRARPAEAGCEPPGGHGGGSLRGRRRRCPPARWRCCRRSASGPVTS